MMAAWQQQRRCTGMRGQQPFSSTALFKLLLLLVCLFFSFQCRCQSSSTTVLVGVAASAAFQQSSTPRSNTKLSKSSGALTFRNTFPLFASCPHPPDQPSAQTTASNARAAAVTSSILNSLRQRTPVLSCSSPTPLNLETDFYDPTTGLHSEGVWHNTMAGVASLVMQSSKEQDAALKIADALWGYSWDGISFQRRARSGLWDHSSDGAFSTLEQPNYYRPDGEHRCVQHGMALVFWSQLLCQVESDDYHRYKHQHDRIRESFLDQFWDKDIQRWHTVSQVQGGGTVLRPAASSGRPTEEAIDYGGADGKAVYYYRSVDQAVAVLACLGILNVRNQDSEYDERGYIERIIQKTCQELLSETGFAYGSANARSYIGLDRNRNFWHDGWTMLALIGARRYVWHDDPKHGENQLRSLFRRLIGQYGHRKSTHAEQEFDGTVWHWERSLKQNESCGNVRYCGDNALLYAIIRNLDWAPGIGASKCESAFWEFVSELRSRDGDGLVSVADVNKQIRLHPNTELAALLVWQF